MANLLYLLYKENVIVGNDDKQDYDTASGRPA